MFSLCKRGAATGLVSLAVLMAAPRVSHAQRGMMRMQRATMARAMQMQMNPMAMGQPLSFLRPAQSRLSSSSVSRNNGSSSSTSNGFANANAGQPSSFFGAAQLRSPWFSGNGNNGFSASSFNALANPYASLLASPFSYASSLYGRTYGYPYQGGYGALGGYGSYGGSGGSYGGGAMSASDYGSSPYATSYYGDYYGSNGTRGRYQAARGPAAGACQRSEAGARHVSRPAR